MRVVAESEAAGLGNRLRRACVAGVAGAVALVSTAHAFAQAVDHLQPFGAATGAIGITISVGVALARGTDPVSPEMLLQEADRSLYKAKTGGRNRIFA